MLTRFFRDGQWRQTSQDDQYWIFQIVGWSALTMLTYLSLTLWYNPGEWQSAAHTVLQSILGLIVSHPLRWVARGQWSAPVIRRVALNSIAVLVASLVWTALRLTTFEWLTGEQVSASDWGGWLNASIIVYGSWIFCYHALKYYRQLIDERELVIEARQAALDARAQAQEETLKRLETESLFREAQLRMLKYQLNPHFLFNALNSVTSMVQKGDQESATEMLARIGDFLRISLEHDETLQHTVRDEMAGIDLYLAIEKARFGDRLKTVTDITDQAYSAHIPSFILQPLFENALKYAVGQSLKPTTVSLRAWTEDNWLEIRLSDTGADASLKPRPKSSTGIGLKNVEARLHSTYGGDYRFELKTRQPRGTCVSIAIPFQPMSKARKSPQLVN